MATQIDEIVDRLDVAAPSSMWATLLSGPGRPPARIHVPVPLPRSHDLLLRVLACGLAEPDRMLIDGLVSGARYPIIPGHEVVGEVVDMGHHSNGFSAGDRVGVSRLGWACGRCQACLRGSEHLCRLARLTGFTHDGGMAEYMRADYRFCVHLPSGQSVSALAPSSARELRPIAPSACSARPSGSGSMVPLEQPAWPRTSRTCADVRP